MRFHASGICDCCDDPSEDEDVRLEEAVDYFEGLEVRILRLEPGDSLAVRSSRHLTIEQARQITDQVNEVLPGTPVMILPPELDLVVVRTDG